MIQNAKAAGRQEAGGLRKIPPGSRNPNAETLFMELEPG